VDLSLKAKNAAVVPSDQRTGLHYQQGIPPSEIATAPMEKIFGDNSIRMGIHEVVIPKWGFNRKDFFGMG
jgi:hypothetical protein